MTAARKRAVARTRTGKKSVVITLSFAFVVLLGWAPSRAGAATLDTAALLDLTSAGNFVCSFTNLDPAKTATLNASGASGLVRDDGAVVATFPTSLAIPPGQTATTIRTSCTRNTTIAHAAVCRCHFDFSGVGKSKVRASLTTDAAGSVAAD